MHWILILALAGCSVAVESTAKCVNIEHADAVSFIWNDMLGMDAPPCVSWVDGQQCKDLALPAIQVGNVCAAGTYSNGNVVIVRSSMSSVVNTALAHELMHAFLELVTGDSDHSHARREWIMIPVINDELIAHDL
jgi:hypothetical protein